VNTVTKNGTTSEIEIIRKDGSIYLIKVDTEVLPLLTPYSWSIRRKAKSFNVVAAVWSPASTEFINLVTLLLNRKIGSKEVVAFADGDPCNYTKENIKLISKTEFCRRNPKTRLKNEYITEGEVTKILLPYKTQVFECLIDSEDYPKVFSSPHKYYARLGSGQTTYYTVTKHHDPDKNRFVNISRIILDAPAHMMVDHINGNGLDNRKVNLRLATNAENGQNKGINKANKSGVPCVQVKHSKRKGARYVAGVTLQGEHVYLGTFDTLDEAKVAVRDFKEQNCPFAIIERQNLI
jgi:hypothetical protein